MHLLTQSENNVAALELMRHLGVSYRSAWLIKHKLMEVMYLRERPRKLTGRVEIDDAYLGGERTGGKPGRGSENKMPFVAAVQTTEAGQPQLMCLSLQPFTKEAMRTFFARSLMLPLTLVCDGLSCFEVAGEQHSTRSHSPPHRLVQSFRRHLALPIHPKYRYNARWHQRLSWVTESSIIGWRHDRWRAAAVLPPGSRAADAASRRPTPVRPRTGCAVAPGTRWRRGHRRVRQPKTPARCDGRVAREGHACRLPAMAGWSAGSEVHWARSAGGARSACLGSRAPIPSSCTPCRPCPIECEAGAEYADACSFPQQRPQE